MRSTLRLAEGDEYGILDSLGTLALAHSRVRKKSNNHSKEHTPSQRRGINDIIDLAFNARLVRHCDFKYVRSPHAFAYISYNLGIRTEKSHRLLVALDGNPNPQSGTLVTIPSTIITDKIRVRRFSFPDPTIVDHLYWSTGGVTDVFSIIGFA